MKFDALVNPPNEVVGNERWNSPLVSFSSIDGFGVSSDPIEREPYIPKYVEVNYIEGSNDKKWSVNFPWTKKLEVLFRIVVEYLICIDVILIVVYLLPLSGQ